MTGKQLLSHGRSVRISLFTFVATLAIVGAVSAQEPARSAPAQASSQSRDDAARKLVDLQSRVDALQMRVDALDKDGAIADVRRELNAVRADIATQRAIPPVAAQVAGAQERTAPPPAPAIPGWVLAIVGGLFAVAWALVNVLREGSRRQEAITSAVVKLAEKASKETANQELSALSAELKKLVTDAGQGSLSFFRMLRGLFRL